MRTSAAGTRPAPHAPPLRGSLPPEGAQSARGGPARILGFTLLELMVVVAIMAMATAGVSMAMRDTSQTQLERDAQRLAALLETARAHSRMSANAVVWRATPKGFVFEGLPQDAMPTTWMGTDVVASSTAAVLLGPEPIIGPQRIRLASLSQPTRSLSIVTDGVRPFKVSGEADESAPSP